jgi:transcriptional regulator with XRE-family HTH domain
VDMSDKDRADIAARLRALQQVLGASEKEMAEAAGVSRQAWSNYVSRQPENLRLVSLDAVRNLKRQFGIPGEWIFLGDAENIKDPDMRRRLNSALANPQTPKRGRRPAR